MKFKLKNELQYESLSLALPGFEERFQTCCRKQFYKGDQFCVDVTSESGHTDNFELYQDWHVSFYFDEIYPIFEARDPFFFGHIPPKVTDDDWDRRAFCELESIAGTFRCIAEWTGKYWALISPNLGHNLIAVAPTRYIPTSDFPYCCMNK